MQAFYKRNSIIYTSLFGLWLLLLFVFESKDTSAKHIFIHLILYTQLYGIFLLHNLYIFPQFFNKKKWPFYLALQTGIFALDFFVAKLLQYSFSEKFYAISFLINRLLIVYVCLAIHYGYLYYQQRHQWLEMQLLKRDLELKQLKIQLHPHFLYNALNNIYSYLLINDLGKGKELILRLSELMRHITESADNQEIPLTESISFIKNYLAFEQERLGERCNIVWKENLLKPERIKMIPLLFFPLIENAFKHGTNSIKQAYVEITVQLNENQLEVNVVNGISDTPMANTTQKGLRNLKRQLELAYENNHQLIVYEEAKKYYALLKITVL